MQEANLFLIFVEPLNKLGSPYMVTGSLASMLYGEPRLTHDIDIVLELRGEQVPHIARLFPEEDFYHPPEEVLRIEMARARRGHFNLIHHESGFKADVYLIGEEPLQSWGLERRRLLKIGLVDVPVAPPEYVILKKLLYFKEGGSEKHLRDIESMFRYSGSSISLSDLAPWISSLNLEAEWAMVKRSS